MKSRILNSQMLLGIVAFGFLLGLIPTEASAQNTNTTSSADSRPLLQVSPITSPPCTGSPEQKNPRIGSFVTLTLTNVSSDLVTQLQQSNKLVLVLAGVPFPNLFRSIDWPATNSARLQFELAFGPTNRAQWSQVLQHSSDIPVAVELGNNSELQCQSINLIAMDTVGLLLALSLLILFGYVSFFLITRTEMVRDPNRPSASNLGNSLSSIGVATAPNNPPPPTNPGAAAVGTVVAPEVKQSPSAERTQYAAQHSIRNYGKYSALAWAIPFLIAVIVVSRIDVGNRNLTDSTSGMLGIAFMCCVVMWVFIHFKKYWISTKGAASELRTYSLARTQMAVWFFLIVSSWVFLWLLTGTFNTLTNTVLALMGIGAGTALGAEVQDAGKPTNVENITQQITVIQQKIQQQIAVPMEIQQLDILKSQLVREIKNESPATAGFFEDVLTDADGISFHRFQMFVWTLVLGIVFIAQVCQHLNMPDFDSTLLALMGISSGTYLGFMIKEPHSTATIQ